MNDVAVTQSIIGARSSSVVRWTWADTYSYFFRANGAISNGAPRTSRPSFCRVLSTCTALAETEPSAKYTKQRPLSRKKQRIEWHKTNTASICNRHLHALRRRTFIPWKSLQRESLLVLCKSICCFFLESGICFTNLALASVSYNAVQVERTQQHEGHELRGAALLTAPCARQKYPYVSAHVRRTPDDDRARVMLCVPATWFPGGDH